MSHANVDNETDRPKENHIDFHSQLFSSLNLNDITIEDIEEVIEKDKVGAVSKARTAAVVDGAGSSVASDKNSAGVRGGGASVAANMEATPGTSKKVLAAETKILIQPAQKALRFRYECEGRSAGSIPGANSIPENKTYPTIQVVNYTGPYAVVVSCVTKDLPYRPHPHKLVGKEGCKRGICTVTVNNGNMICSFSNLGIQCVKRKDIEEALRERSDANIDPFRTGASHKNQTGNIDLNSVRLCFQVFLKSERGTFTHALPPVVSDTIYDKKSMCDLVICKLSACSASVWGGAEIIILCEKIVRDDIQVRFYEVKDGQIVWEGFGDFQPSDVHKQVAISLKTPKYKDADIQHPVEARVQLRRPSDGTSSDPRPFQFLPVESDPEHLKRKRQKVASASLGLYLAENAGAARGDLRATNPLGPRGPVPRGGAVMEPRAMRHPQRTKIKTEPPDVGYTGLPPNYPVHPTAMHMPLQRMPPPGVAAGHSRQLPMYGMGVGQAPARMVEGTPSVPGGGGGGAYGPIPLSMPVGSSQMGMMYGLHPMAVAVTHGEAPTSAAEVITIPSYSSSGSSNPIYSGSNPAFSDADVDRQQQQQGLSSGSTQMSLGLGSLGSLSLSESTLGIIGSHLCDTFMCLNSSSIEAELNSGGGEMGVKMEYAPSESTLEGSESAGHYGAAVDNQQQQQQGREPSMDSFSGLLSQLTQLNEMGAIGGMDVTSPQTSLDKYRP